MLLGQQRATQITRLKIVCPDLRKPKYEHLFHDPHLKGLSDLAKAHAIEAAYAQYTEQAILNGMLGNCVGMVRTTIAAGATAQTSLNTGSLANAGASGNMDQTPSSTGWVFTGHPQASPNQNQYTAIQALKLTASAATSLTFASQAIATAITSADAIFVSGGSAAGGASGNNIISLALNQQLYIGLSTQAFAGATQSNVLSGEPTATGSYDRIGHGSSTPAPLWNNQANWPIATAASPSVLTTANGPWSFPQSSAAWSTTSTNLQTMFIADALTLAGGDVLAIGALGTPQAVNAANITLSFATGAITLTLT
jgi:hypothetical protein